MSDTGDEAWVAAALREGVAMAKAAAMTDANALRQAIESLKTRRCERGLAPKPSGVGRNYPRLNAVQRLERMDRAGILYVQSNSYGVIAVALQVSKSTAHRLVKYYLALLNQTEAQRRDEAMHELVHPARGRPPRDGPLEPDRVVYKCHQMAKCTNAGTCLEGNPTAWGESDMPCSRQIVKSWRLRPGTTPSKRST